jgi:hypothetical protein
LVLAIAICFFFSSLSWVLSFYEVWQGFITKALGRISKVYLEGTLYTLSMPHKKQEAPYTCKKPLTAHDLLTA